MIIKAGCLALMLSLFSSFTEMEISVSLSLSLSHTHIRTHAYIHTRWPCRLFVPCVNRILSVLRDCLGKYSISVWQRGTWRERLRANSSYCGFAIAAESKAWLVGAGGGSGFEDICQGKQSCLGWIIEDSGTSLRLKSPPHPPNKTGLLFEDSGGKHAIIFPL